MQLASRVLLQRGAAASGGGKDGGDGGGGDGGGGEGVGGDGRDGDGGLCGGRLRGGGLPQAQLLASEQQGERMRDAGQMRRLPSLHDKLWWECGDRDGGKDKRTCWVIQEEITTHHRSRDRKSVV